MDYYGFYTGQEFSAYTYLGAHLEAGGTVFRTFAPNASRISVIGDFNHWSETPMEKVYDGNFWECHIENAARGMRYKYRIYRGDGTFIDHCDPYGFYAEPRPQTASVIYGLSGYAFRDAAWQSRRKRFDDLPMNIYEIHAGSWRKPSGGEDSWYSYRELADLLVPYLSRNHYNFVEVMPLSEYPCDASWGYQATGFFSPTSRYGDPDGLRYFVDTCHAAGIGAILDFVPVHFAVNDYALARYDGTALYEYPHSDVGFSEWGSCNFLHARGEVRSFLQSAAYYWLKEFHFDGLRMDAVSNLIYWQGVPERGENQGAIQFIRNMNKGLKERVPSAILIAEDSSSYKGVTAPVEAGGLGFDYKWDLGWMHDTLSYLQAPPAARLERYHKLTFSMHYFYNEKYLLPLSHDEVVHGKAAIAQKMNGADLSGKFAQARLLYMYMFAHPGKKLNFMGNELGHLREWDEKREMDWALLHFPRHDAFLRFARELNELYLREPAFYEMDHDRGGFQWVIRKPKTAPVFAWVRKGRDHMVLAVFNFGDTDIPDYTLDLPGQGAGQARLLFHSDWDCFGGATARRDMACPLTESVLKVDLKRFSALYFALPPR